MADSSLLPSDLHSWSRVKSCLLGLYHRLIGRTVGLEGVCKSLQDTHTYIVESRPQDASRQLDTDEGLGQVHGQGKQRQGVRHHLMAFVERMVDEELDHFLYFTLPGVIQLALAIDEVDEEEKSAWCLYEPGTQVLLSRQFMCSLLACHFLHLSLSGNPFSSLTSQFSIRPSVGLQLQSVLDYFDWVIKCGLEVKGQLILHRKVLYLPISMDDLFECDLNCCPLTLLTEDRMNSLEDDMIQVHFNSSPSMQARQEGSEDTLMRLYPELLTLEGRVERMAWDEALVVSGLDSFSRFLDENADTVSGQEKEDSSNTIEDILVLGGSGPCLSTEEQGGGILDVRRGLSSTALQHVLNLAMLGFSGLCHQSSGLGHSKVDGDVSFGRDKESNIDSLTSNRMDVCNADSEMSDESSYYRPAKHSVHQDIFSIDDLVGDGVEREQELGEQTRLGSGLTWMHPARQQQSQQQQQHQSPYEIGVEQESIPSHHQQLCTSSQFAIPISSPMPLSSSSLSSLSPHPPSTSSLVSSNKLQSSSDSSAHASLLPSISTSSISTSPVVDNLPGASTDKKQHSNLFRCSSSHIPTPRFSPSTSLPLEVPEAPGSQTTPSSFCESQTNRISIQNSITVDNESHQSSSVNTNQGRLNSGREQGNDFNCQKPFKWSSATSPNLRALHVPISPTPTSHNPPPHRNYNNELYSRFLLADILGNLTKSNSESGAISRTTTSTTTSVCNTRSSTTSSFTHSPLRTFDDADNDVENICSGSHHHHHAVPIYFSSSPSSSAFRSSSPICDSNNSSSLQRSYTAQEREDVARPGHASSSPIPIKSVILNPSLTQSTPPSASSSTPAVPVPTTAAIFSQPSTATTAATVFIPLPPLQVDIPPIDSTTATATTTLLSQSSYRHSNTIAKRKSSCPDDKNLISPSPATIPSASPKCHHQQQHQRYQTTSTIHLEPPLLSSLPQSTSSSLNNSPNSSFTLPDPALIRNTNFTRNADVQVTADFFIPGIDDDADSNNRLDHSDNTREAASTTTVAAATTTDSINATAGVGSHQDYPYPVLAPGTNGSRDDYLRSQLQELISSSSSSCGSTDRGAGGVLAGQMGFPPPLSSSGCSHWGSRSGSISSHGTNGSGSSNDFMELWYSLRRRSSQMSDASRTSSSSKHSSDFSTDLEDISETFSKHAHEVIKEEEGGALTLLSDFSSYVMDTAVNEGMAKGLEVKGKDDVRVTGQSDKIAGDCNIGDVDVMMEGRDYRKGSGEDHDAVEYKERLIERNVTDEKDESSSGRDKGWNSMTLRGDGISPLGPQLPYVVGEQGSVKDDSQSFLKDSSEPQVVRDVTRHLYVNVSVDSTMFSSPADSAFHSEIVSQSQSPSSSSLVTTLDCDPRTAAVSTSPRLESGFGDSSFDSTFSRLRQSAPSPNATFSPPQQEPTVQLCSEDSSTSTSFAVLESKVVYLENTETKANKKHQQPSSATPSVSTLSPKAISSNRIKAASAASNNKDRLAHQQFRKSASPSSIPSRSTTTQIPRTSPKVSSQTSPQHQQRQSPPKSQPSPAPKTSQIPGRGHHGNRKSPPKASHFSTARSTPPASTSAKSVLKSNTTSRRHPISTSTSPAVAASSRYNQKSQPESSSQSGHVKTSVSKVSHKSSTSIPVHPKSSSLPHSTSKRMPPLSSRIPKSKSSPSPSTSSVSSLHSSSTKTITSRPSSSSSPSLASSSTHSPRSRYLFSDVAAPLKATSSCSGGKTKIKHKHDFPATATKGQTWTKKGRERKSKTGMKEQKSPEHTLSKTMKMDQCREDIQKLPTFWQFVNSLVLEVTSKGVAEGAELASCARVLTYSFSDDIDSIDDGAGSDHDPVDAEELSDEVYNWFADKIVHQVFFTVLESIESKDDDDGAADDDDDGVLYTDEITGLMSQVGHEEASGNSQGFHTTPSPTSISVLTFRGDRRQATAVQAIHPLDDNKSTIKIMKPIATTPTSNVPCHKPDNSVSTTSNTKVTTLRSHSLNKTVSFEDSSNELVLRTGSEGDLSSRQSPSRHHHFHHHHHHQHPHHRYRHHQRTSSGSYYFNGPPSLSTFNHQRHHHHHHERLSTSAWSVGSGGSNDSQEYLNMHLGGSSSDLEAPSYGSDRHSRRSSLLHVQKRLTKSATDLARWSSLTSMECSWGGGGGSRGSSPNGSHHNLRADDFSGRSSNGGRTVVLAPNLMGRNSPLLATPGRRDSLTNTDSTSHGSLLEFGRLYGASCPGSMSGRRTSSTNAAGDNCGSLLGRSNNIGSTEDTGDGNNRRDDMEDPQLYEAAVSIVNQVFNSISDTLDLEILRASDNQHQPDALYPGASYRSGQYHNIFSSSCQTVSSSPSSMRRSHHHHHRSVSPSISVFSRKPMSRESLTNAFLKVDSQPSVKNYERRSSEPCHTSVQLSLEVFNKNRYNYRPMEEPQQTACTDDDIGRTSSRINWRRGSLDNNFSFEGSRSHSHHGNMSGFKDPILSRFAEELMKADTSVPELVIVGSNPSSCTTGSRRSSFSGFRDTTLANLESELLNTSFTSMNSLPLSQSPRSVGGRSSQATVTTKGSTGNNRSRTGWDQQQVHQLQSDSSDTEHWFPPPRQVGDEFHLEFTRQHSQGGQDEVQDLASFFAGCVVQEAVCVIKSDPDFLTEDEMAIGLYAENLTDQILRDVFISTRGQDSDGMQGQSSDNCNQDLDRDERKDYDDKTKPSNKRSDTSTDSRHMNVEKDGETGRVGRRNTASTSYHGEGARPKVRTLSSSSTRTHMGGRLSSSSTLKGSSQSTSNKKSVDGQHSHRNNMSRNTSTALDSKQRLEAGESSSSSKSAGVRVKVSGFPTATNTSTAPGSSSNADAHHHPQQDRYRRRHHQSDFGSSLSSVRSSRAVPSRSASMSSSLLEIRPSSSTGLGERKLFPPPAGVSASAIPKRNSKSLSSSTLSFPHERTGKSKIRISRSSTTASCSGGDGGGYSRFAVSDFSSGSDTRGGHGDRALQFQSARNPQTQEDQPHPLSSYSGSTPRRRQDSEASSSCLDSDPSSSSPRPASGLDDRRRRKFTRQDALSSSSQHRKTGSKSCLKGNRSNVHSRRPPQTRCTQEKDQGGPVENQGRLPVEVAADRFASVLTDRIVTDALREVELLPWWRLLPRSYRAIATHVQCHSDTDKKDIDNSGRRLHHHHHGQFDLLAKWIAASLLQTPHLVLSVETGGSPAWLQDAKRIVLLMSNQSVGFLTSAITKYWHLYGDGTTATTTTTAIPTTSAETILAIPKLDESTRTEAQHGVPHRDTLSSDSLPQSQSSSSSSPPPPPSSTAAATSMLPSSSSLPTLPNPSLFQFLLDLLSTQQDQDDK